MAVDVTSPTGGTRQQHLTAAAEWLFEAEDLSEAVWSRPSDDALVAGADAAQCAAAAALAIGHYLAAMNAPVTVGPPPDRASVCGARLNSDNRLFSCTHPRSTTGVHVCVEPEHDPALTHVCRCGTNWGLVEPAAGP